MQHKQKPKTAAQLMRSRYSAFCLGDVDYLCETMHPSKRTSNDRNGLQQAIEGTHWQGLIVISSSDGKEQRGKGVVEFSAFFIDESKQLKQLHERSNFVRENDSWYYLDGKQLPPIKIGRNDLCYCGSGKKFKKCHYQ